VLEAGLYLLTRSAWNRIRRVATRLRQPRYALAVLVGVAYLSLVLFGQRAQAGAPVPVPVMQLTGTLVLAILAAKWWLFGADRLALAFSPAEIQFLFPAPVSRSGLLTFKLLRAQFLILINVAIWLLLLNRGRGHVLPLSLHAATLWAMFSTLFLHRLGVALTRDSLVQHGRAGLLRNWPALVGLVTLVIAIFVSTRRAVPAGLGEYPAGILAGVRQILETPPLSWVLLPFQVPFLPLAAPDAARWVPRFLAALALIALHLVWIFRADKAFEEAAIEASARRAELLDRWRRQGARPRPPTRRTWRWGHLAPSGHPVRAIIWKNLTRLIRTATPGVAVTTVLLIAAIIGFTVVAGDEHVEVTVMIATLALSWVAVLAIFGPQWVRNDLRGELEHLQVLRTWPVSGVSLMAGQVFSSSLVLTGTQGMLAIIGLTALARTGQLEMSPGMLGLLYLPGLVALGSLNLVALAIQNAGALLYPSWVRSEIRPAGIEAMGQHLLTAGISLLLLLLAALGPLAVGGGAVYLLWNGLAWWSLVPGLLLTAAGLSLEGFLLLDWMGGRFERLDITPVD
jgi:Putative ABC exporter